MQNYKLTFTAGAPGSCWSMISNRFKRTIPGFDRSDEVLENRHKMPSEHVSKHYNVTDQSWAQTTHNGSYLGPYHEFGHGFDNIQTNYTKEDFFKECLGPFGDDSRPLKLVRSHWFSYNLDWIWNNCKGHDLFLIWREPEHAENWWYSMGGWNIDYPIYKWYETPERMHKQIKEESNLLWNFAKKHQLEWWDFDVKGEWIYSRFPKARRIVSKADPIINDTIKVCHVQI